MSKILVTYGIMIIPIHTSHCISYPQYIILKYMPKSITTSKIYHARILVSALEHQMSLKLFDHQCNLKYASK